MTKRKLYQFGDSPCCMKVRMVLEAKGLDWEEVFVESWKFDHLSPEFLNINPEGTVPVLDDDGHIITQSNIISEYLEDAYPEPALRPQEPAKTAFMRKWMATEQKAIFPHIVTLSFNIMMKLRVEGFGLEQLTEWSGRHPNQKMAQNYLTRVTSPVDEKAIAKARQELRKYMETLDSDLTLYAGDWLCGTQFSLADIALAGIMDRLVYLKAEGVFDDLRNVTIWFEKLKKHPAYSAGEHRFSARMWGPLKPVEEYRDLYK